MWQQQAQHGREAGIAPGPPSASLARHGFKLESLSQLVKSHWVEGESRLKVDGAGLGRRDWLG